MAPLRSLKIRIALTIFVLEGVMMAIVLWQTAIAQSDALRAQFDASDLALMAFVSRVSRSALITEDFGELRYYFAELQNDPRVERVLLSNPLGVVVASADINDLGQNLPTLQSGVEAYWRLDPIDNPAGRLGTLAMQMSAAALRDAEQQARVRGWEIASIGMAIIAVVGVLIGYLLTRRLERLALAAAQFAKGHLAVRVNLDGGDEVTEVGRAFDVMAENLSAEHAALSRANQELARHRDHLEEMVVARTAELETATSELESVAFSASHDLRTPLRAIHGFSQLLEVDCGPQIVGECAGYLRRIRAASVKMSEIIDALSQVMSITRTEMQTAPIDLCALAWQITDELRRRDPERQVELVLPAACPARGDVKLLTIAIDQLLGNAWKFTRYQKHARIEFGVRSQSGEIVYCVRDNGVGFNMAYANKLFKNFQRLHAEQQYEGSGVGLSIVQRIIHRHGGRVWAEAQEGKGATFCFTLGEIARPYAVASSASR